MSEQNNEQNNSVRFADLSLSEPVQAVLDEIGYETPTPIQAQAIPVFLEGRDLIGQAQTGTGKTAAFGLPLLSMLDPDVKKPQALILAPTRELALQVAEAIEKYGKKVKRLGVVAIYGGADVMRQVRQLERNPAIVVGTPGRVMDHMRRGRLDLSELKNFVLDEADEMLRMGFIEDVEWILEHAPASRQTGLFSATMPPRIAAIAKKQMRDPITIAIKNKTATVSTVRQRFVKCNGMRHKIEALTNLLETEERDAAIIFTRTRSAASMIAEELIADGHSAEAIHGDIAQARRERAVGMLKSGKLDILVATDVAARGLDVDRISHVFNFDIPDDVEPYIHRIGRAGRAGRSGDAILLVTRRDMRQLKEIERVTRQQMEQMPPPTRAALAEARQRKLEEKLKLAIESGNLKNEEEAISIALENLGCTAITLAAALLKQSRPAIKAATPSNSRDDDRRGDRRDRSGRGRDRDERPSRFDRGDRGDRPQRFERRDRSDRPERSERPRRERPERERTEVAEGSERFRIEVGHNHQVRPGNIVGAIANEAGLDGKHIGNIEIFDDYTTVDLPSGMPREVLTLLKKTWVSGQQMRMSKEKSEGGSAFAKQFGKNKRED